MLNNSNKSTCLTAAAAVEEKEVNISLERMVEEEDNAVRSSNWSPWSLPANQKIQVKTSIVKTRKWSLLLHTKNRVNRGWKSLINWY